MKLNPHDSDSHLLNLLKSLIIKKLAEFMPPGKKLWTPEEEAALLNSARVLSSKEFPEPDLALEKRAMEFIKFLWLVACARSLQDRKKVVIDDFQHIFHGAAIFSKRMDTVGYEMTQDFCLSLIKKAGYSVPFQTAGP